MTFNAEELIKARAYLYKNTYPQRARLIQDLKERLREESFDWEALTAAQAEALDMICHKIGRIITGNPNEAEHWKDIAGYATLIVDEIELPVPHTNSCVNHEEQLELDFDARTGGSD